MKILHYQMNCIINGGLYGLGRWLHISYFVVFSCAFILSLGYERLRNAPPPQSWSFPQGVEIGESSFENI